MSHVFDLIQQVTLSFDQSHTVKGENLEVNTKAVGLQAYSPNKNTMERL